MRMYACSIDNAYSGILLYSFTSHCEIKPESHAEASRIAPLNKAVAY